MDKEGFDILKRYITILVLLIITIFVFNNSILADLPPIMDVDDIKSGQTGYAKTVFEGTKIEEFQIEVMNKMEGQNIDSNLILIKAFGEKIDQVGGIASGMSGSPVYVDDKLIGAISYKWENADHNYAMVTPIMEMLNIKEKKDLSVIDGLQAVETPIMVGGLENRAYRRLKDGLNIDNTRFVSGVSTSVQSADDFNLKPGSALAIQLVRGDVSVASIGTVTAVDKNELYAFGHSFMNKGKSNYLMSGAHINAIISSQVSPFKVGSPLDKLLGIIESDRSAGIYGRLDKYPNIIPLTVSVKDNNLDVQKEIRTQIINDEKLLNQLGSSIILQAIDSTLDRIGYGTSQFKIEIMGSNLPNGSIKKENMYYSNSDIAVTTLDDYIRIMDMVSRNPFKEINIFNVKVDVEVDKTHDVALIQEAKVLNEKIYPGSELEVEVVLRPYRADPISRELAIKIPEDINIGMATLAINGGYSRLSNGRETQQENENDLNHTVIDGYKSFEEMIEDYLKVPKNNELTLQVYPSYISRGEMPDQNSKSEEGIEESSSEDLDEQQVENEESFNPQEVEEKPEIKKQVYTDYVLEGNLTLDFEVKNIPTEKKGNNNHIPEEKIGR